MASTFPFGKILIVTLLCWDMESPKLKYHSTENYGRLRDYSRYEDRYEDSHCIDFALERGVFVMEGFSRLVCFSPPCFSAPLLRK